MEFCVYLPLFHGDDLVPVESPHLELPVEVANGEGDEFLVVDAALDGGGGDGTIGVLVEVRVEAHRRRGGSGRTAAAAGRDVVHMVAKVLLLLQLLLLLLLLLKNVLK
jgi:hypothetical protein